MIGFVLAFLMVLQSSPAVGQPDDRAELSRLEQVWNDAHVRGDADALDRLWAEEIVVTVPAMPVMRKPDSVAIWRSGRMKFQRYETSDTRIQLFGDTGIVTGRLLRTRNTGGGDVADDWRFTKVYVRRGGVWRVVAWHASPTSA